MPAAVTVSLIISTYNWPEALNLVLQSVFRQKQLPTEVLVADDGSTAATKKIIEQYQKLNICPVHHVWQKDEGFRLARSRNNALRLARGYYIIFIDGDSILHPEFIADHLRCRAKNNFVVGSRVLLKASANKDFFKHGQFSFHPLKTAANNKLNALHSTFLSYLTQKKSRTPVEKLIFKIRGCNLACHYQDIIAVNGFNEDFQGWGREDSEFALRLLRRGLILKRIKFAAIQYHLFHPENKRERLAENQALLDAARHDGNDQCPHGIIDLRTSDAIQCRLP